MSLIPVVPAYEGDFFLTISGNNVVLSDALTAAGWSGDTNVRVRVSGNIGSTSSTVAAIICDVVSDLAVTLIVPSGSVVSGKGGDAEPPGFEPERDGGDAISVTQALAIVNEGTIQGGGGSGGRSFDLATLGGGGAGLVAGTGGVGSSNGTLTTGGAGGSTSGDGGGPGQNGESAGGNAGQAGKSITGYSLVTYSGAGTLTGATES